MPTTNETATTVKATRTFNKSVEDAKTLLQWWRDLDQARGDRAELRRATSFDEVVLCRAYHDLRRRIHDSKSKERLARVAIVAAQVREDLPKQPCAEQLANPRDGGQPVFSVVRMRRLLEQHNPDDALGHLRRAVRQLKGSCNLIDLAESAYWWNDRTRRDWAYAYFERVPRS